MAGAITDTIFRQFKDFTYKLYVYYLLRISQHFFHSYDYIHTVSFNNGRRHRYMFVHSLRACHSNASVENIYNGCRTNAAAEASYDRERS